MVSVWPVDDLFAFFDRFLAGVTSAGEAGCHLLGNQYNTPQFSAHELSWEVRWTENLMTCILLGMLVMKPKNLLMR